MSRLTDEDTINHLCRQLIKQNLSSFVIMNKNNKYILISGEDFAQDIRKKYQYLDYFSFVKDFQNNTGHHVLVLAEEICITNEDIRIVNFDVVYNIPLLKLIKNNIENIDGGIQSKYKIILTMIEKILSEEFLDFISYHSEMKKYILDKESKSTLYKVFNNMLEKNKTSIENILDNIWLAYHQKNEFNFIKWLKECSRKLSELLYIINLWVIIYYLNTDAHIIMCYINREKMMFIRDTLENMNWKIYF